MSKFIALTSMIKIHSINMRETPILVRFYSKARKLPGFSMHECNAHVCVLAICCLNFSGCYSSPPQPRRCAGGSYGSALPSSAAPLIRRNGGEVFFAQACEASRHCACGARHRAVRLHDLEVGVDVRLHRQHLCGNVSRSRSSKV